MKKGFSVRKLMHNDRLMMVFSLLIAIVVWAAVVYGPSNVETRTLSLSVTIDLKNTYAETNDIRVVGTNTFTVEVQVQGARSVIGSLDATDIRVSPDVQALQAIQGAGKVELALVPRQNSRVTDYTFLSVSPATVTVECDYWVRSAFPLTGDISAVQVVKQDPPLELGAPHIDTTALKDGAVTLEGPKSIVGRVRSVVARVVTETPISSDQMYSAPLLAFDEKGDAVDVTGCTFVGLPSGNINITVPVLRQQAVDLSYTLQNAPASAVPNVQLSHKQITLIGSKTALEQIGQTVANLGVINFDTLRAEKNTVTFPLTVSGAVRIEPHIEYVTATVDLSQYTERTFAVPTANTKFIGTVPAGLTIDAFQLSGVVVCGPEAVLEQLRGEDLQLQLNTASLTAKAAQVPVRVQLTGDAADSCWVYYGNNGYSLPVTVQ